MSSTTRIPAPSQPGFSEASGGDRGDAGSQNMKQSAEIGEDTPTEAQMRSADLQKESVGSDSGARDAAEASGTQSREEEIRQKAYERYLRRGGQEGNEVDDWLEAERHVGQGEQDPKR